MKHYTSEEQIAIPSRHRLEKQPILKRCDELALQPTVFYRGQKEFLENRAAASNRNRETNSSGSHTWRRRSKQTNLGKWLLESWIAAAGGEFRVQRQDSLRVSSCDWRQSVS
ncbi:MAG: hypothetical protein WB762_09125 [Candidatus Sulfotelmatobacter sp.]